MISRISLAILLMVPGRVDTIDTILEQTYRERNITPAPRCTDEEFLRRASLDILGRIPTIDEVRKFRENPDRDTKIDELLRNPEFPRFWSEIWTAMLVGYSNAFDSNREGLRRWLERVFSAGTPWDEIVAELIGTSGSSAIDGPVNFLARYPGDPTVKISRAFLGLRLDCARCHDHPFDRWTNEDYVLMRRFFEATDRIYVSNGNVRLADNPDRARGGKTPKFLTGSQPVTTRWREEFALFLVKSRPFARAFANRLWYHFLGRGIVNPPDDFNLKNVPSVPALLEHLATEARRLRWDVSGMIRTICASEAYQRSSRGTQDETVFARYSLKPLAPEQIFDSLVVALGINKNQRGGFLNRFTRRSLDEDYTNAWDYRETVRDLMGKLTADHPLPTKDVDEIYLRLLSRNPTDRERELCQGRAPDEIVFALVNSNEFFFNH